MPQLVRHGSLAVFLFLFRVEAIAYAAPSTTTATATGPDRRFHLAYVTEGAACPDRTSFVQSITLRTTRARLVDDSDQSPDAIAISARVDDHAGHFSFKEPDGSIEEKSVTGSSCAEIAHALALSIGLLLDPENDRSPRNASVASLATPTPSPSRSPLSEPTTRRRPLQPTASGWHPSGGAELGAISGIGPAISPLVALFFELDHPSFFGPPFSAYVRLGFQAGETRSDLREGTHTYELFVGSLRACPFLAPVSRSLRVGPCGAFQIGGHRGTTRNVQNPESSTQLWMAPLVLGTVEWALGRKSKLELSGGPHFPLRRSRFFLAPDTTIYQVPRIGFFATISASIHFL